MKKIAIVSTNKSAWGGSEYLWYYTALRLKESNNIDLKVSIPRWKDIPPLVKELSNKGIEVIYNTGTRNFSKKVRWIIKSDIIYDYKNEGFKFLIRYKPDLVIINQGGNTGGIDLMEYCLNNNLKFVTISNVANEAKWPDDELNKRLSKVLPEALINFYVSKANLKLTEIQIGQDINNAEIIMNPFNVRFDNDIAYPEVKEFYYMANVARHEFYAKGQDLLFQVLDEKKWRERNIIVNLYGKGLHSYSVEKLIRYFDLANVKLNGHINPEEIWKINHALLLTSRYEGLPLALIEAMLCGRTGVVTKVSGNPEVMFDNETGFLANAATPEFIDEAMERAWSRRNEWETMGLIAKQYIKKTIHKDPVGVFAQKIMSLLN
ncbi:MAG: Glycosyltransferase Gtf1 [Ignavibacteria bacterium]|nr:Glycosyltransferase Gtf1 [Ignavibacteria bacterium]